MDFPEKIVAGSEEVSYIYSATGQKLATKAGSSTTYYRGSFIYNDNELDHLLQPEGIIRKTTSAYVYYYAKKDHLGSTRVLCHEANGKMIVDQTTDYYPFGLTFRSNATNVNRYLFSGKELQEQMVNGKELQLYDFGARNYDPMLGRWFNIDPLAAKNASRSPYTYCFNDPVNVIDPDGRDGIYIAFPQYKADGYPLTGHAGVLLINNKTGLTKYYEYGRYNNVEEGLVNNYSVPNVIMKDGMPTVESLNKVLTKISNFSGKGEPLEAAYIKSDDFDIMNKYAVSKLVENSNENRKPYNIITNNCGTFADDVIKQDKNVKAPSILDPRPVSIIDEYQNKFTPISYIPQKGTFIKVENKAPQNNHIKPIEVKQNWWKELRERR